MLKLLLEYSQLMLVLGCDSSHKAWEELVSRYEQPFMQNIVFRERKYRECKMAEGTDVQEHITQHKRLVRDLAAVGQTVSEQQQVMELILSLPPIL